jgi:hypothetical protein
MEGWMTVDNAKALEAVFDLERDLEALTWLLKAIPLMVADMEKEDSMPICQVAWHANDHIEELWKRRSELLKLLGWQEPTQQEAASKATDAPILRNRAQYLGVVPALWSLVG